MSTLRLTRHAETVWHSENRYAGTSDVGLSSAGRRQALDLASWAEGQDIRAVYASDLSRAVLTAAPVALALGLDLRLDARLREVAFGVAEGLTSSETQERFPREFARYRKHPATWPLPGGESGSAALERVWPALEEIAAEHPDDSPLLVMHSTLIRLIVCRISGVNPDSYRTVFPYILNTAVTTISLGSAHSAMLAYNVPTGAAR